MEGTAKEQAYILREIQDLGYNVIECPNCNAPLLMRILSGGVRTTDEAGLCFLCKEDFDTNDTSDLVFPDEDGQFQNI